MRYIIFGAGNIGEEAAELVGKENISFFIDNDLEKQGTEKVTKRVYSFDEGIKVRTDEQIMVAVSDVYEKQLVEQLKKSNIKNYCTLSEIKRNITKDKILSRPNYINIYNKAIQWIKTNSIEGEGIINNTKLYKSYPEVTGYYIPTLIQWGYRKLAVSYAEWLCSIQKEDGSWYDTFNESPYVFDSAQILKGLLSVRNIYPDKKSIDRAIINGCNWILSCVSEEGRLKTPDETAWGDVCTELIHTYCLSPLIEAANIYNRREYEKAAHKILEYYKKYYYDDIVNFNMLSHFYAYVMEAMIDMGEINLAEEAMKKIEAIQKESGAVPAYRNVDWVCSTGLFQLAVVWFRLGNIKSGNKAFSYACKLQNKSGGWFGSYVSEENSNEINTYFPSAEISWVIKYFLDALYYKNKCQFEMQAPMFLEQLTLEDGRYEIVKKAILSSGELQYKVLDVGCGKGRYLKNLATELPANKYFGVDISLTVMKYFEEFTQIEKRQGNLTNIPYEDNYFDIVYTCETLEHAIDITSAIREMVRVTRTGGKIIVIDKNKDMYGYFDIEDWEQWFDKDELKKLMMNYCTDVEYVGDIDYDNQKSNGLFGAWIGTVI